MSKLVDERVVEMKFDNSNFERNTRQTMNTIQKLKSSLNFGSGLETATKSFSAWEVASITAISNVTDRVVNLGIQLVKSLSVDNIASGWEKFNQQTKSTGTIISQLSNTMDKAAASELTSEYMKKLQWYSDATSYSLSDMTDAISKFIGKGQDMDTSFKASVGIANWAATAGKNAQEAQIAFNALSKVADHVLSRQWTSIQLGTMDTIEFKNAVLEAAVETGTLTKSAERLDGTIEYMTKKGHEVSAENFTEYFSDEWFDIETLMNVLGKYGYAVNEVMQLNEEMGMEITTPYEALDAYKIKMEEAAKVAEEEGDSQALATAQMALFSAKALEAASEARTLEDAINAVKDAVSTGWLNIFQKVIGEYDQAKEFFSDLADILTRIFTAPTNAINKIIDVWQSSAGRGDFLGKAGIDENGVETTQGAFWNLTDTIEKFIKIVTDAWKAVFPLTKTFKEVTSNIKDFTSNVLSALERRSEDIYNIFRGFFSVFKLGIKVLQGVKVAIQPILNSIKGDSGNFLRFLGNISAKFADWVNETQIFIKVGTKVANVFTTIIDTLKELKVIDKLITTFKEFLEAMNITPIVKDLWKSMLGFFDSAFDYVLKATKAIMIFTGKYVIPALANIIKYLGVLAGILAGVVMRGIQVVIDGVRKLIDYIRGSESIQNGWKAFISFLQSIPERLKKLGPFFVKLGTAIMNFFKAIWNGIKTLGNGLAEVFRLQTIGELFALIGTKIAYGCGKIVEGIKSLINADFSGTMSDTSKKLGPLGTFFKGLLDLLKGVWDVIKALIPFIGRLLSAIGAMLTTIANSINQTFTRDVEAGSGINLVTLLKGGILALLAKGLYDFVYLFKSITAGIYEMFSGIGSMFRAKAAQMWAMAIKDIAMAMLMMVAAILIISMIDENKLWNAVKVLEVIMASLTAVLIIMAAFMRTTYKTSSSFVGLKNTLFGKGSSFKREGTGFAGVGAMILAFGLSILALVAALKIIDSINPDRIDRDMQILLTLMGALAIAVGVMNMIANVGNKAGQSIRGTKGLVGFAIALLIIVAPIKRLGELPTETVWKGIAAMSVISLAFGTMIRIMHGFKAKGVSKMMVFAAAMLSLVVPIETLGSMPLSTMVAGVAAVSTIALVYGAMVKMGSQMKITAAIGFIASITVFGYAINAIVNLINSLAIAEMNWESMGKFAVIFVSMVSAVTIIFNSLSKFAKSKNIVKSMLAFVIVVSSIVGAAWGLAYATQVMNGVRWDSVFKTLTMIGFMLLASIGVIAYGKKIVKRVDQIKPLAKKLAIFGGVLVALIGVSVALAYVGKIMNDVNWSSVFLSMLSLGIVIVGAIAIIEYCKRLKVDNKLKRSLIAFTAVMLILATMSYIMAAVATKMKDVGFDEVLKTLALLGTTLLAAVLTVVVASKFEKQITKVAASLMMLGAAFALFGIAAFIFAKALQVLSANSQALLVFAGIIVVLGLAMKLLSGMVTSMLLVATVFALIGAAALALGGGFYLTVLALGELLPYLDELAEKSEQLETVIAALVKGVVTGIAESIPKLVEQLLIAVDMVVQNIMEKIAGVFDFLKNLKIEDVLEVVNNVLDLLFGIIMSALTKLAENIRPIADKLITILIGLIEAVTARLPELMNALLNLVLGLISGLGQTIENNAKKIRDTMIGFCQNLWNAFLNFFGIHSPSKVTEEGGQNIMLGIIKGIGSKMTQVVREIIKVGTKMLKEIARLPRQFIKIGVDILKGFLNGLKSVVQAVLDFFKGLWDAIKGFFGGGKQKEEFKDAGKETMLQYKDGLEEGEMDVNKAAKAVIQETLDTLSKTDIFNIIGEQIVDEIATGIELNAGVIAEAIKYAAESVVEDIENDLSDADSGDVIMSYINKLLGVLQSELDDQTFVIKPVLDLEDVKNGTVAIAAMLGSVGNNAVYSTSYSAERASSEIAAARQASETTTDITTTNNQLVNPNGEVYNVTFNVSGTDPKTMVEEIDKLFNQYVTRGNKTWA